MLRERYEMSVRAACRLVGVSRNAYTTHLEKLAALAAPGNDQAEDSEPADKYAELRAWLIEFASTHRRWGYRRA